MNFERFATLCRICATETRRKTSAMECVYIFKTPMLQEKIENHLHLKVSEDDALPKVICKSCYRSVEGIVSLSKIAIHTQMVLSNFLKPAHVALIEPDAEFTPIAPISCKDYERMTGGTSTITTETTSQNKPSQQHVKSNRPEEVIVNVSVTDPLTRESQQKIIGANRQRHSQHAIDARFVPQSIASQRQVSFAKTAPIELETPTPEPTNLSLNKKSPSSGCINYFTPQQQQQRHVTVTSGGYVIGHVDTPKTMAPPPKPTSPPQPVTVSAPIQTKPQTTSQPNIITDPINNKNQNLNSTTQQRNLKSTPKNSRATNAMSSGQISLLKVSQKSSAVNQQQQPQQQKQQHTFSKSLESLNTQLQSGKVISPPLGRKASRKPQPQRRPTIADIPSAEALPKEIIIAGVKKPKQNNLNVDVEAEIPKSIFPDDIPLGRVIRDFDLLKLIMKALKWPVNKDTMEAQMSRLRNSKFTTIMSDPNLLQDTDLTQLLGPYLAPVLLAAQVLQQQQQQQQQHQEQQQHHEQQQQQQHQQQQQEQQQLMAAVVANDLPTDITSEPVTDLASAIPYRLPPETSVQLVPASPEDERPWKSPPQPTRKTSALTKKSRRSNDLSRSRESSILVSEGDEKAGCSIRRKPSNSTKLLTTQRKHPEASPLYPSFVDDIVLMEPEPTKMENILTSSKDLLQKNYFGENAIPPVTRPIIKRRKTVIQASPQAKTVLNTNNSTDQSPASVNTIKSPVIMKETQTIKEPIIKAIENLKTNETNKNTNSVLRTEASKILPPLVTLKVNPPSTAAAAAPEKPTESVAQVNKSKITSKSHQITPKLQTNSSTTKPSEPLTKQQSSIPETISETTNTTKQQVVNNKVSVSTSMTFFAPTTASSGPIRTSPTIEKEQTTKKLTSGSKAALAEQLLEAVGLKKSSTTTEKSTSNDSFPNSRESIQQIRSALKRSLKQAVEQNLRKLEEEQPVIKQVADSTTKVVVKNVANVEQQSSNVTAQPSNCNESKDESEDKPLSLLKSRNASAIVVEKQQFHDQTKRSNAGKRKSLSHTSVIKKSQAIPFKGFDESRSRNEGKTLEDQDSSSGELFSSGNAVTSTSRSPQLADLVSQVISKRSRKRKGDEATTGDAAENSELETKQDIKAEFDAELGDIELSKEIGYIEAGGSSSSRPSRISKSLSKYYKGPDRQTTSTRPLRSTRNK